MSLRWWGLVKGRCVAFVAFEEPVASAALQWCPAEQHYRVVAGLVHGDVQFFHIAGT
jgi:hypothetical protein